MIDSQHYRPELKALNEDQYKKFQELVAKRSLNEEKDVAMANATAWLLAQMAISDNQSFRLIFTEANFNKTPMGFGVVVAVSGAKAMTSPCNQSFSVDPITRVLLKSNNLIEQIEGHLRLALEVLLERRKYLSVFKSLEQAKVDLVQDRDSGLYRAFVSYQNREVASGVAIDRNNYVAIFNAMVDCLEYFIISSDRCVSF